MVNHGISRGCETCKRRRKKCDETRPHCRACIRTNRICPGYREDSDLVFRQYKPGSAPALAAGGPVAFEDVEVTSLEDLNAQLENFALEAFFSDFTVRSKDRTVSRGYLDGLAVLVDHAGCKSDLARAARMVAFACMGRRWHRPYLIERGRALYPQLLRSFSHTIADRRASNSMEALMTCVLLGLYEMIKGTTEDPGSHGAHARGVTAILHTDDSPFDLLQSGNHLKLANPLLLRTAYRGTQDHLFRAPLANDDVMSMDMVARATWDIVDRAEKLLHSVSTTIDELADLMERAKNVDEKYASWPDSQPREWRSKIIGYMDESSAEVRDHPLYWPGPVETYFDLYVSTIWNTFRKGRLLTLELISQLAERFEEPELVAHCRAEARVLATSLIASLPYFLTADPAAFVAPRSPGTVRPSIKPGRSVGGLLILHPLYIASKFEVIDYKLRSHMMKCIAWIGDNLGIGQATVLSDKPHEFQRQFLRDAHILVWAGMVNQPT